jgi:hypothetical protein
VCRPVGFAVNGGIARIEVVHVSGKMEFMDVCLSVSGYMALHRINAVELTASSSGSTSANFTDSVNVHESSMPNTSQMTGAKPNDEESVSKWYNIVLINALTALIDDLNADGEVCLHIDANGKACVENGGNNTVVYEFGEMPDVSLWEHITERLSRAGLFAEVQDENRIFISWV